MRVINLSMLSIILWISAALCQYTLAQNIAQNKPTLTSSNYSNAYDGSKAVDGDTGTKWTTQTGVDAPHWIRIDLQQQYNVTRVKILHAATGGEPNYFNTKRYSVQLSLDGSNWTTVATYTNSDQHHTTHHDPPASQQKGRYVRFYIHEANFVDQYARIPEIEVYGSPASPGEPSNLNVATPECASSAYTASFTWSGSGPGWWLDVSENSSFPQDTRTYHKRIDNLTSTTSSGLCMWFENCSQTLSLLPGRTYHWRIWNGSVHTTGQPFTVGECGGSDDELYGLCVNANPVATGQNPSGQEYTNLGAKWVRSIMYEAGFTPPSDALNNVKWLVIFNSETIPQGSMSWSDYVIHFANEAHRIVSENPWISAVQIGNEPDIPQFHIPENQYASLLKQTYIKVKTLPNPPIVVSAGLASGAASGGQYLDNVKSYWNGDIYFDKAALHPYQAVAGGIGWPAHDQMDNAINEFYRHTSGRQIWVTEFGIAYQQVNNDQQQQAQYLTNCYNLFKTLKDGNNRKVEVAFWFAWDDRTHWNPYDESYGLVDLNHNPRPAWYSYRGVSSTALTARQLSSPPVIDDALDNEEADLFNIYPVPADHTLNIKLSASKLKTQLTITDMQGKELYTKELAPGSPHTEPLHVGWLKPGIYIIQVQREEQAENRRFVHH
ncbi:discoidin domain-containing protein [Fulvivirga sp. 29W222]|uniref:Discoidin domain-containing protein n=1 Tax=Fulvivirga marina TaxID=2494733 RepID=A0A937G1K8_9BACT|nr:discoidin domain-containing protein [Fulvivirga marina]MBL6448506.1 discoidin domain-containing protein [Fulvivirga marina]